MADPAHKAWTEELAALVGPSPGVELKKMMGSYAIMSGGRMFAFPWDRGLCAKLPPEAAERLVAQGQAKPFEMRGRRMGGWYWMPASSTAEKKRLPPALEAAKAYVAAAPAAPRRRSKQTS